MSGKLNFVRFCPNMACQNISKSILNGYGDVSIQSLACLASVISKKLHGWPIRTRGEGEDAGNFDATPSSSSKEFAKKPKDPS
jgi:hypothetical protein